MSNERDRILDVVRENDFAKFKDLLQRGADIWSYANDAFELSIRNKNLAMARYIVEYAGASVYGTKAGDDALCLSVDMSSFSYMKFFIDQGADIHLYHDYPLRHFIKNNDIFVVKYLIEYGADVNARDGEPLHYYVMSKNIHMIEYLITHGVNPDSRGNEALIMCIDNNENETAKLLIEYGADIHVENDYALRRSFQKGNIEMMRYLIKNGADVHALYQECID